MNAIAAATRQGGDVEQAPCEASQSGPEGIAQKLQALGCPYPHSDIQSSFWLMDHAHDNDLFKHSRELCDRFPELLKREGSAPNKALPTNNG